jgi:type I restriction enzyme S subunit
VSDSLVFDHYPLPRDVLPQGWALISIEQIARLVASGFPSGQHNQNAKGVPHIRPMNIDRDGRLDLTVLKYVEGETPRELKKGDVLFNNTNSPELIGKTTAVLVDTRLAYSNHMTRIRLEDGLNPSFVARQLHFLWMCGYFRHRCVNHVNQASISADPLSETVPVLLPPVGEQERIANALDELLSDLDAGVAALERVRDKLKLYRAAVLKAAVEGALTVEWRKDHPHTEPAPELLKRILAERRRRWEEEQLRKFKEKGREPPKNWKAKYKEPVAPDTTDLPPLPEGWCWASGAQLFAWSSGEGLNVRSATEGRYPVYGGNGIAGRHDNYICETPTVVIGRVGAQCGNIHTTDGPAWITDNAIYATFISEQVPLSYLKLVLTTAKLIQRAAGSGQPFVNQTILNTTLVPLPPSQEQGALAESVDDQLSIVDHLESDLDAKLTNAQALRQSILRDAFSGKLVPQDPNDEPASELLKRIAAEREQRAREAARAKKLNGHKPRRAAKPRGKTARGKPAKKKELEHGRIADR